MKPNLGMPPESVRGRVRVWLERHAVKLVSPVLDIGARISSPAAYWANNRSLRPDLAWTGIDAQPGHNVDQVGDAEALPFASESFGSVVCTEVLEHAWRPAQCIVEAYRVLRSGGWLLVTTPFAFPVHNFPSDYWRLTPAALERLLREASFATVEVETAGEVSYVLNDHGEPGTVTRTAPVHVFATAQK